jgi:hypothetical protein
MTAASKKQIIRSMTVDEISSVDSPAVKGATAVLLKAEGAPIRKNASEVVRGQAEPLFMAADYSDAMIARSVELAKQHGTTPETALMDHCGTDPVLIELACTERSAENAVRQSRSDRHYAGREK